MGTFKSDGFRMFISAIDIWPDALEPDTFGSDLFRSWTSGEILTAHIRPHLNLRHVDNRYNYHEQCK